jgi:hypothetical protein
MRRLLLTLALTAALAGCAGQMPRPGDMVRDTDAAIRIGQRACSLEDTSFLTGKWHATYRAGYWRIWFWMPDADYGPTYQASVRASDGQSDGCEIRVATD